MQAFNNILITPYQELIEKNIGLSTHKGGPCWTNWENQVLARHCRGNYIPVDDCPTIQPSKINYISQKSAWCGAICGHFGHQIVEFSMRLSETLAYDSNLLLIYAVKPAMGVNTIESTPKFFRQILEWYQIQENQICIVSEPVIVKELIVFPQAETLHGPVPSMEHLSRMTLLTERNQGVLNKQGIIYVSRAKLSSAGSIAGEKYLDYYLAASGVKVIYPEQMTLRQQLDTYMSAKHLIFSEGSALHGLQLLGMNLGDISIVLRRSGATMWKNAVAPRAKSYKEVDCFEGLIMTYNDYGTPLDALGVSVLNEEKLLSFLESIGISTKMWSSVDYIKCRDEDLRKWLRGAIPRLNVNSISNTYVINILQSLGLEYLMNYDYKNALDEYNSGNYDLAIKLLQKSIDIEADVSDMHKLLSVWLDRRGRIPEAMSYALNAIKLSPENPHFRAHLSNVLIKSDRVSEALEAINQAIEIDSKCGGFYYLRSQWLDRLGKQEQSIMAAQTAVELSPQEVRFKVYFANLLIKYKLYERALIQLDEATELDSKSSTSYRLKSIALEKTGYIKAAISAAEQAVLVDPEDKAALEHLDRISTTLNLNVTMKQNRELTLVDCTFRDGGYYNNWDFNPSLISDYLLAMAALDVDYVEIGFRSLKNLGFKGGCAYSTDSYVNSLNIPLELKNRIGVMINGAELCSFPEKLLMADFNLTRFQEAVLSQLFTSKSESPVTLVRIACHVHEFKDCLPAANWLKNQGYKVGFNLMQVADRTLEEMTELAKLASQYPVDVLYFADSMGSLTPEQIIKIVRAFRAGWNGALGVHTHDNMGQAVANTLQALDAGVTWVDSTVTGMGRGPGNAQTEYLALALEDSRKLKANPTKLLDLIRKHFKPLQNQYGWGTNPYYYLAGKYGIHPTYIQEMLSDTRYNEEDILAVISHLKIEGGKKFSFNTLDAARHFYSGEPRGRWNPADMIEGKEVLILGTGHGVAQHCSTLETYITKHKPFVIALNTQSSIKQELINIRAACHPVRLLADCHEHLSLQQPLATPASMLPEDVKQELSGKELLDFGLCVQADSFSFQSTYCTLPTSLVIAYALAIATSGKAKKILLAGFDGYGGDDPRTKEMEHLFKHYQSTQEAIQLISITPTRYEIDTVSVYALIGY